MLKSEIVLSSVVTSLFPFSFSCELIVPIIKSVNIKARVFDGEEKLGTAFSQDINFHKAIGKRITINKELSKSYPGSGAEGLINGISGSDSRYGDKEWLGYWGEDIEVAIDLGEEMEINSIETRFYNGNGQWIYAPQEIEIAFDNGSFETYKLNDSENNIIDFKLRLEGQKTKTIMLKIPNFGTIPEGKQGSGNKAWTFVDEIIIN